MISPSRSCSSSGFETPDFFVFDRPGPSEIARLSRETAEQIEGLDGPADLICEVMSIQMDNYAGPIPPDKPALKRFVISQFRSAAGPTAVSAMLDSYVEINERMHMADLAVRMLAVIRSQARPALTCDAIAIAIGSHIGEGRSMQQIASAHGITKQALSKRAIRICQQLGLPPSPLMRSLDSRESYRRKQLQRHAAAKSAGFGDGNTKTLREKLNAARQHLNGHELRALTA